MAAKWLTWAYGVKLTPTPRASVLAQRHVLVSLANHANHEGVAWPSAGRVAETGGIARSTVSACLSELERSGYITPEGERSRGGPRNTTRWRLNGSASPSRHLRVAP